MGALRVTEAELARDPRGVMTKVRAGAEVVIEDDHRPVAVLKSSGPARPGRKLSECIAMAKANEAMGGGAAVPDEGFARDVQSGIDAREGPFEPAQWD